jgi:hypothetical protein
MEYNQPGSGVMLLPRSFKIIGFSIVVIYVLSALIFNKILHYEFSQSFRESLGLWFKNILIVGLFFIVWSKNKTEDERTVQLRLRSLVIAFSFTVMYFFLVSPFIDILAGDKPKIISAHHCLIMIFTLCIGHFELMKRSNKW